MPPGQTCLLKRLDVSGIVVRLTGHTGGFGINQFLHLRSPAALCGDRMDLESCSQHRQPICRELRTKLRRYFAINSGL